MSHLRLTILALALAVPSLAHAADGGVYLYLQPLPPEASPLTFTVAAVSAVAAGGEEYPLKVNLAVVGGAESGRQRLLASGRVPPGAYTGFAVTIAKARVRRPEGEIALAVPEAPVRLGFQLEIVDRQSALVWLSLKYAEVVQNARAFNPAFDLVVPARPISDHAGYVTNSGSNTITVFDKQIGQAVGVIDTCAGPAGLALDQRRRRLYVACPNDDEIDSIDVAAGRMVDRASASPGDGPREVALSPDGNTLVAVNARSNSVTFFDTGALSRADRVTVGNGPSSLAIDPTGRRVFVFNTLSATVSVLDLATRSVVATLSTEASPLRGKFSARGDRLYIIHERSPYMTVLDAQQLTVVSRARVNPGYSAIAVDFLRGLIGLGGPGQTTIDFYDPNALLPLYTMRTGAGVSYLTIVPDDNTLYMVSPEARSVLVGRLADRKVVSGIDVGDRPYWVAIMGEK